MEKQLRKNYIDVLKGIGIFFVVFGHVTHSAVLREYIWGFHMPLFFLISGFLFNNKKHLHFNKFFLSRMKSIYLPYVFFFLITFLYWVVIERKFRGGEYSIQHQFLGLIYGTYEGYHLNFNGALWFLPCLFSVELMFYYVSKIQNKFGVFSFILFFFIMGSVIKYFDLNVLPLGIHTAFFGIVFFGIGFISKSLEKELSRLSLIYKMFLMVCCIFFQVLAIKDGYSNVIEKTTIAYIPIALLGVLFYFILSSLINKNKSLEYIGQNSLIILAFQEQTYRAVIFVFSRVVKMDVEVIRLNVLTSLVITIVSILVIMPLIILYNRFIRVKINKLFVN